MPARPPRWPWLLFVLAAAWSVLIRVPLVVNAPNHLDSDLAVDGLTLLAATRGDWRWHYPGTPFIGIGPVFLSLPQALLWGATSETLVSGGVVASLGLLLATFLLAWRTSGPRVAAWSLVPLTFASNGAVWLSGRITGGHLTAAAWHAGAFALLAWSLGRRRDLWPSAALGLWCGVGLALDSMFAVTLAGLVAASAGLWLASGLSRRALLAAAVFGLAFLGGVWPRYVGARVDPYDAYRDQFSIVRDPDVLKDHARLLMTECLPRLLAGHRLPGLETDPEPAAVSAPSPSRLRQPIEAPAVAAVGLTLALGLASVVALVCSVVSGPSAESRAVAGGLLISAAVTLAGFVANRNIFNSDNYRYLVGLLVPWSLGFGLVAGRVARRGKGGAIAAGGLAVVLGVVMTADLWRWYARFGWVDGRCLPVSRPVDDPTLAWLDAHPEVTWVDGGYWDVYRLAFLTGGRVRGAPFPIYPNRFPEWRPSPDETRVTVVRPTPEGRAFADAAVRSGLRVVNRARGVTILSGP